MTPLRHRLERLAARYWPRAALFWLAARGDVLGAAGETLAVRYLARRGWSVLGRRLATPRGEPDVVARDGDVLVVVEVKTGRTVPGRRWRPGDRFRYRDRLRMERAARWLAPRVALRRWRVDLVEVFVDGSRRGVDVQHHRGRVHSE